MLKRYIYFILMAVLVLSTCSSAQSTEDLIKQLTGKADAPQRSTAELSKAYAKAIDYLIPHMSADDVGSQYPYQIMLQDMGSHASRPGAEKERSAFAAALIESLSQDKLSPTLVNWYLLQIQRTGGPETIAILNKQLLSNDVQTRDYARRALEIIPDPSAGQALVQALKQAKDPVWQAALIRALGTRGEAAGAPPIISVLEKNQPTTTPVAIEALALIGEEDCLTALVKAYNNVDTKSQKAICHALLDMAWVRQQTKYNTVAANIYKITYRLPTTQKDLTLRAAALAGLAQCKDRQATGEIVRLMKSSDPKIRRVGAHAASVAPTTAPIATMASTMKSLSPEAQIQVIALIEARQIDSLLPNVRPLLEASTPEDVRVAAIQALVFAGQAQDVTSLLKIAQERSSDPQKAALAALAKINGPGVDKVITTQAAKGDAKQRAIAIDIIGMRSMTDEVGTLIKYAKEDDRDVVRASLKALKELANEEDIKAIASLIANTTNTSTRSSAVDTLRTLLNGASDKKAASSTMLATINSANADAKIALISSLNALGGQPALETVLKAHKSSDTKLKDTAFRTLCDWPELDAGKHLLDIAKKSQSSSTLKNNVLALRGIANLVKSGNGSEQARAQLGLDALDTAQRSDEKKLVIAALASVPTTDVAKTLMSLAKDKTYATEAGLALTDVAYSIRRKNRKEGQRIAEEVLALNISDKINQRAQNVANGKRP